MLYDLQKNLDKQQTLVSYSFTTATSSTVEHKCVKEDVYKIYMSISSNQKVKTLRVEKKDGDGDHTADPVLNTRNSGPSSEHHSSRHLLATMTAMQ